MADFKIRGLPSVVRIVKSLCRINGLFAPVIRSKLTGSELAAYNALVAACEAFMALFPTPGTDNDPGTEA